MAKDDGKGEDGDAGGRGDPFDGDDDTAAPDTAPARRTAVDDANDLMFPDAVPTVKFADAGDSVEGVVLNMQAQQQTDIKSNEPLWWDDGRPRMQVVVTLQTGERDPDIEGDDGRRRLFVKSDMMRAVRDAVKEAGYRKVALGATLAVRYERDGKPPRAGLSAPKVYQAIYTVPEEAF